jgi:DNA helicase-2/ATP-dependent DNA helicase PcrA
VLEDVLVRQGVSYQVIGGPRFYERAEIKDAIAYLQAIDNPYDAVSLTRVANRPRRGHRRLEPRTPADVGGRAGTLAVGGDGVRRGGGVGAAPQKAVASFRNVIAVAAVRGSRAAGRRAGRADARSAAATRKHSRPNGTIEAQGRLENLQELVGVAREYQENADEPSLSSFLQEISLYSTRTRSEARARS